MRKYVTESQINAVETTEDYRMSRDREELTPVLERFREVVPDAHFMYGVFEKEDGYQYNCTEIHFKRMGMCFALCTYYTLNGKYQIRTVGVNYEYLSNASDSRVTGQFEKPNNMGVFTKSKVDSWVSYLFEVNAALEEENEKNRAMIENFIADVEKEKDLVWNNGKKSGCIKRMGIEYSFRIETAYIGEQIKISNDVKHTLAGFRDIFRNTITPIEG